MCIDLNVIKIYMHTYSMKYVAQKNTKAKSCLSYGVLSDYIIATYDYRIDIIRNKYSVRKMLAYVDFNLWSLCGES